MTSGSPKGRDNCEGRQTNFGHRDFVGLECEYLPRLIISSEVFINSASSTVV